MKIQSLSVENFRCFPEMTFAAHERFNLFIGVNGTGKTSVLEALRIAAGALFMEMGSLPRVRLYTPHIKLEDVRLEHLEQQFPVVVEARGRIFANGEEIAWKRTLTKASGRTTTVHAKKMKLASEYAKHLALRGDQTIALPLVAYFSTERYKREKSDLGMEAAGSRLRGYYHAMDIQTNMQFFKNLFRTEAFAEQQEGKPSAMIQAVQRAATRCIMGCQSLRHNIRRDMLIAMMNNGEEIPFEMLSDGIRSMLAMVMEIALRACLLNPWLLEHAAEETPGVILIDELDLHLHPAWQRRIITDLCAAFPKIQFFATTHSPVIVGSLSSREGALFALDEYQVRPIATEFGRDANSVLVSMGSTERHPDVEEKLRKYFLHIEVGEGTSAEALLLRSELDALLGANSPDMQRANAMLSFFEG
jgi:predicted ATP-binding protein involved in virulence